MTPTDTPADVFVSCTPLREGLRSAASALKENGPGFALAGSYSVMGLRRARTQPRRGSRTFPGPLVVQGTHWRFGRGRPAPHQRRTRGAGDAGLRRRARRIGDRDAGAAALHGGHPEAALLNEHHCGFAKLLPAVRAVGERLDWEHIRAQTAGNDYAVAFLVLADRLGLTG
jgi:hypothetical protein